MQVSLRRAGITESAEAMGQLAKNEAILSDLDELATAINAVFRGGGRLLTAGNGGSFSQALHLAGEFCARFEQDRQALPAIACGSNPATLTAVANDQDYRQVFARDIEAFGGPGDILMAFSTSGRSPSIVSAVEVAHDRGLRVAGLTGESGGNLVSRCDWLIRVPSSTTARIQEMHLLLGHLLVECVEAAWTDSGPAPMADPGTR